MGRLTADVNYKTGNLNIARYTLAVNRKVKKDEADFISCVAFGKAADFAEKYFKKGTRIAVTGHIQTGSYKNKDGVTVYTTDVIVEEQEFAESKNASASGNASAPSAPASSHVSAPAAPSIPTVDSFMSVPGGDMEELPFN